MIKTHLAPALIAILITMSSNAEETDTKLSKVIAHRGASYEAPENTLASIQLAIDKQAAIIEFDVNQTSDDGLYLFHDQDLKRLTNQKGSFSELTSAEAEKLNVSAWFNKASYPDQTPPTLTAAIQLCIDSNCTPLIEHKTGSAENYARILTELDAVDQVIVQSFDWQFIAEIRKLLPALKIGALGSKSLLPHREKLAKLKPNWLGWKYSDLKPEDVEWLKKQNITIATWTVNDPKEAQRLIEMGVDQIITDRPVYISQALK